MFVVTQIFSDEKETYAVEARFEMPPDCLPCSNCRTPIEIQHFLTEGKFVDGDYKCCFCGDTMKMWFRLA